MVFTRILLICYAVNSAMEEHFLYNSDYDFLVETSIFGQKMFGSQNYINPKQYSKQNFGKLCLIYFSLSAMI